MSKKLIKFLSLLLCFCFLFEQAGFAQIAGELDISGHIAQLRNSLIQDKFRPLHLRYLSYDNLNNNFKLLLDKGDLRLNELNGPNGLNEQTKTLLNYFFIGISLPNSTFWVNLRPDSEDNVIDVDLAKTDIGKILLEQDLQLKKDTAHFTSPETLEGKDYWNKLYSKAEELFGSSNITIPTLTRPWIVPDEIIIRETPENAYIYKATLKVLLEQDYLKDSSVYNFQDERLKELNRYSSQLIRELIIPKLTKEVNISKKYAPLRQVYYSLILAQWFKQRFYGKGGLYSWLIDRKNLNGLTSKTAWSKTTYFKEYQKSFTDGEYNLKEPIYTPLGQTIRSYMSGGMNFALEIPSVPPAPGQKAGGGSSPVTTIGANPARNAPKGAAVVGVEVAAGDGVDNLLGVISVGKITEDKSSGSSPVAELDRSTITLFGAPADIYRLWMGPGVTGDEMWIYRRKEEETGKEFLVKVPVALEATEAHVRKFVELSERLRTEKDIPIVPREVVQLTDGRWGIKEPFVEGKSLEWELDRLESRFSHLDSARQWQNRDFLRWNNLGKQAREIMNAIHQTLKKLTGLPLADGYYDITGEISSFNLYHRNFRIQAEDKVINIDPISMDLLISSGIIAQVSEAEKVLRRRLLEGFTKRYPAYLRRLGFKRHSDGTLDAPTLERLNAQADVLGLPIRFYMTLIPSGQDVPQFDFARRFAEYGELPIIVTHDEALQPEDLFHTVAHTLIPPKIAQRVRMHLTVLFGLYDEAVATGEQEIAIEARAQIQELMAQVRGLVRIIQYLIPDAAIARSHQENVSDAAGHILNMVDSVDTSHISLLLKNFKDKTTDPQQLQKLLVLEGDLNKARLVNESFARVIRFLNAQFAWWQPIVVWLRTLRMKIVAPPSSSSVNKDAKSASSPLASSPVGSDRREFLKSAVAVFTAAALGLWPSRGHGVQKDIDTLIRETADEIDRLQENKSRLANQKLTGLLTNQSFIPLKHPDKLYAYYSIGKLLEAKGNIPRAIDAYHFYLQLPVYTSGYYEDEIYYRLNNLYEKVPRYANSLPIRYHGKDSEGIPYHVVSGHHFGVLYGPEEQGVTIVLYDDHHDAFPGGHVFPAGRLTFEWVKRYFHIGGWIAPLAEKGSVARLVWIHEGETSEKRTFWQMAFKVAKGILENASPTEQADVYLPVHRIDGISNLDTGADYLEKGKFMIHIDLDVFVEAFRNGNVNAKLDALIREIRSKFKPKQLLSIIISTSPSHSSLGANRERINALRDAVIQALVRPPLPTTRSYEVPQLSDEKILEAARFVGLDSKAGNKAVLDAIRKEINTDPRANLERVVKDKWPIKTSPSASSPLDKPQGAASLVGRPTTISLPGNKQEKFTGFEEKFSEEMDRYLDMIRKPILLKWLRGIRRIKYLPFTGVSGAKQFKETDFVYLVETQEENPLTYYRAEESSILIVDNLGHSERLVADGIYPCLGFGFYASTGLGPVHGIGHLVVTGDPIDLSNQTANFAEKLPNDITQLQIVFYYSLDKSEKRYPGRKNVIENLKKAINDKFPFAVIINVESDEIDDAASVFVSPDGWGIYWGYLERGYLNRPDKMRKIIQFWLKDTVSSRPSSSPLSRERVPSEVEGPLASSPMGDGQKYTDSALINEQIDRILVEIQRRREELKELRDANNDRYFEVRQRYILTDYILRLELLHLLGVLQGTVLYPSMGNDYFPSYFSSTTFGINAPKTIGLGVSTTDIQSLEGEAFRRGLPGKFWIKPKPLQIIPANNFATESYFSQVLQTGRVDAVMLKGLTHWSDYYYFLVPGGNAGLEDAIRGLLKKIDSTLLKEDGFIVLASKDDLWLADFLIKELGYFDLLTKPEYRRIQDILSIEDSEDTHFGDADFVMGAVPIRILQKPKLSKAETSSPIVNNPAKIDSSASSTITPTVSDKGGIDFRALPIVTQPMSGTVPLSEQIRPLAGTVPALNLDKEWQQIENMTQAGLIPSNARIKEYLEVSCQSQDCSQRIDKVLSLLADILRLEEERVSSTEPGLREMLVLLESDKSAKDLQIALSKIGVSSKEPQTIEE